MARIIRATAGFPNIPAGFPIILTDSLEIIEPLFRYLFHVAIIPGRTRSPSTLCTNGEHLFDYFDTLDVSGLDWRHATAYTLAEYRNNMIENPSPHTRRPYSRSTINQRVRTVIRFYKWAHREGLIDTLPFSDEDVRAIARQPYLSHTEADPHTVRANELTLREVQRAPHALSEPEQERLGDHFRDPYRLMARWAIATGLRRAELCSLRVHQIPETFHLSHREHSTAAVGIPNTKGGRPRTIKVPILLLDDTHDFIKEERQELIRELQRRSKSYRPPDAVFLNSRGEPVRPALATRRFSEAFRVLGIDATVHSLRHTFAINNYIVLCRLSQDNPHINPLKVLQIRLGHAHISTTATYLRSFDVDLEEIPDATAFLAGDSIRNRSDSSIE